jgi:RNA polymerase sigma-70 factor (ECF subfamily)
MNDIAKVIAGCIAEPGGRAREEFVCRFQKPIASMIVKTLRGYGVLQPDLIEDLIQDTYVRIFDDRSRILRQLKVIDENTIFGFVQSVAFSTVVDHFRSQFALKRGGREGVVASDIAGATAVTANPSAAYEERLLLQKIETLLEEITLPPNAERDRRIFQLQMAGHSTRNIAETDGIGLSEKGVISVLHRLKAELRVRLIAPKGATERRQAKEHYAR